MQSSEDKSSPGFKSFKGFHNEVLARSQEKIKEKNVRLNTSSKKQASLLQDN